MVVMCRARNTDPLKKIKILLKQRKTGTKPKVKNASAKVKLSSMKNSTLTVDKTIPITSENKKRKFEASLECLLVKRSKLDHCQGTLTKMMKHKWSVQFLCNDGSTFSLKNDSLEVEASHVAKLKSRFADTILRAQSKIGNPCVEVKVIKLASQMKEEECRVKKQLEFERQAARASLEQMERSITLDDNLGAMRDLEVLMRSRMQLGRTENPLEKLGLFIKPEYKLGYDDDDDLFIQGVVLEEGEILNG